MFRIAVPVLLLIALNGSAQTSITSTLCEYQQDPSGIDVNRPRLNWELTSSRRNVQQVAYQIIVSDDTLSLRKNQGNIWDSKKVYSPRSIQVEYAGKHLLPVKTYYWKVKIWDNKGSCSAWSHPAQWQMGLLSNADWKGARWIGYERLPDSSRIFPAISDPDDSRWNKGTDILPLLRKEFTVNRSPKKVTAFISGLGQFDLHFNGEKVGDHFLDPGWTKYNKQALYVTFDLTGKVRQGKNVLGVMLGNGFYYIPGERYHKIKGAYGYPKMICRLVIEYTDGTVQNIVSDPSWKAAPGPVTFSSIYGGEDYDATLEKKDWDSAGYDDSGWKMAIGVDGPQRLASQQEEPLKIFDRFAAQKSTQPKPGVWVYDMGQNASAIPSISVRGKKGSVIKITPGELLGDDGLVTQAPVGSPVYFQYTLKGVGVETWQPRFMYYGFRYIQITGGVPETEDNMAHLPVIEKINSLHVRNAAEAIGKFSCSNELFNQTFRLIDWAIRSNTVSIFTDCPHREKLGWLEQAHLVGSSIRYNYNIATLCRKVVRDMIQSQTASGLIPDIAPEYVEFSSGFRDSPEWGSNGIIMPYYIYQWYGDKQVLTESYDMMTRYAAYLEKRAKDHILYFGLGDWYDIGPHDPGPSQLTPAGITATAIYYYDLTILANVARILNKPLDEKRFKALSLQVRKSYNNKFFNKETGQYGTGSQTANAMSVYMGLIDPADKQRTVSNIIKDIRDHHNGITAGDIGYRYLLRVLDDAGRSDVIFDMNSRSDVPGYGYQLRHGATALTESWQANRISSNNHFMLGHLMEWFYSGLGGIRPATDAVGFHRINIRPEQAGDVKNVAASYRSPYGFIGNQWEKTGDLFSMHTQIPPNTTAVVYLPGGRSATIKEAGKVIDGRGKIKIIGYQDGKTLLKVGSGNYYFTVSSKI